MERFVVWHRAELLGTDEALAATEVASWTRAVSLRLRDAGGSALGTMGGITAAAFDVLDLEPAIEAALALLDELEARDALGAMRVTFGCALGELEATLSADDKSTVYFGEALSRAELLANAAGRGELLLDGLASEFASASYLFGPSVGARGALTRCHPIDRRMPRRSACRSALARLREPACPRAVTALLHPVLAAASRPGVDRFVLRGSSGTGAMEALEAALEAKRPVELLRLGITPGALEPLGSLRLALLRRYGSPTGVRAALSHVGVSGEVLARVARGEAVPRATTLDALRDVLGRSEPGRAKACVLVDPLLSIDGDTLTALHALAEGGVDICFVARAPHELELPRPFAADDAQGELRLPGLSRAEAYALADEVLGGAVDEDILEVIAAHGGESAFGVAEAARALVASGDLVQTDGRFRWRLGPASAEGRIPLRHLLEERLRGLEATATRMLEVICVAPTGCPTALIHRAAALDGLDAEARQGSLDQLRAEAYLSRGEALTLSAEAVRAVTLRNMPPARLAELHRFVADAMREQLDDAPSLASTTLGALLCEGGDMAVGARELLEGAEAAARAGYERSAVRVAASAVQFHPSPEIRARAARLTQALSARRAPPPPPRASLPEPPPERPTVGAEAVRALLAREFDKVDRCVETAIAEGRNLAAADRLRALSLLARGDRQGAREAYDRAASLAEDRPDDASRLAVVESFLLLSSGQAGAALRPALRAVALTRGAQDAPGEAAALSTVAACFRALGRPEDASRLGQRVSPR